MLEPVSSAAPEKRSRVGEFIAFAVILGIIVWAAASQEFLAAFVKLRLWDRDAAGRTVTAFLTAGQKGDKTTTDSLLGTKIYQPLSENGKWAGYFIVSQGGRLDIPFTDLLPTGSIKPARTEFVTVGNPAAEVFVPNARGQNVKYRLEMQQNDWKITEIGGGHIAVPARTSEKPQSGARPAIVPHP